MSNSDTRSLDRKRLFGVGWLAFCYGIPWPEELGVHQRFFGLVIGPFMLGMWLDKRWIGG